jgi:Uma2 family endonuclease
MRALAKIPYLTEEEYLDNQLSATVKHEYVDGQMYAMAGASENHNLISGNIFLSLRNATRGSGCQVFSSDMKLKIPQSHCYYYPDVMLICQRSTQDDDYYKHHPCLIVEVLSKSTSTTDQREKRLAYQNITALRYYLMVDSQKQQVIYLQRDHLNHWQQAILEADETLTIQCKTYQAPLTLASIYEDIQWPILEK